MNIAITGANGFVGQYLCRHLTHLGHQVRALTRTPFYMPGTENILISSLDETAELSSAFTHTDIIIHLAGLAHTRKTNSGDYYRINVDQSLNVAKAGVKAGVKQLIYMSSIKVNGEQTYGAPFTCNDTPDPQDHYGKSKLKAEQALTELCHDSEMQLLVIRPPLIYGDTPKGNLKILSKAIRCHIPLPFKNINNKRDIISLQNLATLVAHCLLLEGLDEKVLLVSNGRPLSTKEIVEHLADKINMPAHLITIPKLLLRTLKHISLFAATYQKLYTNLEIDISETTKLTGWVPDPEKL